MTLKLNERYPGRANNPSPEYPQGSFKNRTAPGAQDGTYLEQDWCNDQQAFFSSLLTEAGITANGQVDEVGGCQTYDALLQVIQDNAGDTLDTVRIDVASASNVNLNTAAPDTRHINITGTTDISSFTVEAGRCYFVRFDGALTLLNSGTLVTQLGADILTAAGDTCVVRATAANVVEVLCYTRAATPFTRSFVSTQLAITSGGGLTVAHGLGTAPFFVSMEFVCVTADAGYSPGDRLQRPAGGSGVGGGSAVEVWPDATNINVRFGTALWSIGEKTTGNQVAITLANWRVVFRAFV